MIDKIKSHLHLKFTLGVIASAFVVAVISSVFFYIFSYSNEFKREGQVAAQLIETVGNSASVALYIRNSEMIVEFANSLLQNAIIADIVIKDEHQIFFKKESTDNISTKWEKYNIKSPFLQDDNIGTILYQLNNNIIKKNAQRTAFTNILALITHSFSVVLLSMLFVLFFLTKKLVKIAHTLHKITPGEKKDRLPVLKGHETDELGILVNDINHLLDATDKVIGEKEKLIGELEKALEEIKTLRGIIPICSHCKDIRDDEGVWNRMEKYVSEYSDAQFSHGICPKCMKKFYPQFCDD